MDKFIQKQMDIASQLYDLINEKGLNQRQLSKKSGVDEPTISEIMRGLANPTLETLVKLEDALNKDLIVAPKFYRKDLEKDGYTIVRPSLSNKLELKIDDLLESSIIENEEKKSSTRKLELEGMGDNSSEISSHNVPTIPEAA